MIREKLLLHLRKQALWERDQAILLAVSGGVDSMVLFDLLIKSPDLYQHLAVAYVDHQLRDQTKAEKELVQKICAQHQIPFFSTTWTPTNHNVEANARAFRYTFFESILQTKEYDILLTAHHLNDQAETLIMKLIREGQLFALKSLVAKQSFSQTKYLIRPLLTVKKVELYQYATENQIEFYEDESNQGDAYTRNRIRKYIIPQLTKENQRALEHIHQVSEQTAYAQQLIEEEYAEWSKKIIVKNKSYWCIDLTQLHALSKAKQYYFWEYLRLESFVQISQKQVEQVRRLLGKNTSQWQLDLANQIKIKRRYDKLWIIIEETRSKIEHEPFQLCLNQTYRLSEYEQIGIFASTQLPDWQADYQVHLAPQEEFWLRKKQPGDRIWLTNKLYKKISRFLIDRKIPLEARENGWVLENKDKNLLAFLPFVCSYLSIGKETDKIHYVLLYKYKK